MRSGLIQMSGQLRAAAKRNVAAATKEGERSATTTGAFAQVGCDVPEGTFFIRAARAKDREMSKQPRVSVAFRRHLETTQKNKTHIKLLTGILTGHI